MSTASSASSRARAAARRKRGLGLACQEPHAERAVARRELGERLVEHLDLGEVGGARGVEATAGPERRRCQPVRRADPARELERPHERGASVWRTGLPASGAEGQQHVAARRGVVAPDDLQRGKRALVLSAASS